MSVIEQDTWEGCYDDGWKGEITPEAFCHPAKYSRGLIRRIYAHMEEEDWLPENGIILDPFGGVALGGLDACLHGLTWVGIELESRFCALAEQNIALWNKRYAGKMPRWGSARIINGDSRQLAAILHGQAGASISSPPFAEIEPCRDDNFRINDGRKTPPQGQGGYGSTPGNLGNMKSNTGSFEEAICKKNFTINVIAEEQNGGTLKSVDSATTQKLAPEELLPSSINEKHLQLFQEKTAGHGKVEPDLIEGFPTLKEQNLSQVLVENANSVEQQRKSQSTIRKTKNKRTENGITQERISNCGVIPVIPSFILQSSNVQRTERLSENSYPAGLAGAVSSPPYAEMEMGANSKSIDRQKQWETYRASGGGQSFEAFCRTQDLHSQGYGQTEGQLGAMKSTAEGLDAAVSSPPWLATEGGAKPINGDTALMARHAAGNMNVGFGKTEGQLTNSDNFWSASRVIVDQLYSVLLPGAHCVWVLKAFVKNKQIVDFPSQWQAMCEAAGFETVHVHHAMLVKDKGTQIDMNGNSHTKTVARKSFFRRLAESKGSPRIDYECVLCMVKP